MSNEREFLGNVANALGGLTAVYDHAKEVRTRGFDAQIVLKRSRKGINTIKVTKENGKLEVVFYNIDQRKFVFKKIATVEITSLDELSATIKQQTGLEFSK